MTNTLTITVRDKGGVNMAAMMSDLGQGLYSTRGAGTELKGTQRITFDNGILSFTDSVRTFTSENPSVWTDMRPDGEAYWSAETGILAFRPTGSDGFIAFGNETSTFIAYGNETSTFIAYGNDGTEFVAVGNEGAGVARRVQQDSNDDIFGGPSWSGLYSMDGGTLDFATPEGDALMTTDATTLELRIGYEVSGDAVQATRLIAREDGNVTWRATYETPQDLGISPGDNRAAVKDALSGSGEPLEFGSWGEPVGTLTANTKIVFNGGRGDDKAMGGAKNDTLNLGGGHDVGLGLNGRDKILGGKGRDIADGGAGKDTIKSQGGNDIALGGAGNDKVFGGAGRDILSGDEGRDMLISGGGNDVVIGGAGRDKMTLGRGDDLAVMEAGDSAVGGAGSDTFLFMASGWTGSKESGSTIIEGGDAGDRVVIWTDDPSAVITAIGARSVADTLAGNLRVEELDLTITGVRDISVNSPSTDLSFRQALISLRPAEEELTELAWNLGLSAYFSDTPPV
ncbi:MAG: calcium-binding protein [Arenibacterium sp.]